jgi:NAD(P)-dependent dehydrogenase (short-subunit alcohol dehydrogenase family)
MIAQGLLDAGATVYITSRDDAVCKATAAELGDACHALPGDAGTPEGVADLAQRLRTAGETRLHILVNNAGRTWGAPFERFPAKAWPGVMAVNVQAPFAMVQELLAELEAASSNEDPARVINIGSIAGGVVNDLSAYSYVASKAAIHQLSRQLASDLSKRHINVNVIAPGYFPTSMTAHLRDDPDVGLEQKVPMKRLGRASDIAGAVVFLSSRAGAYVTGVVLPVDGGIMGCR